MDANEINSWMTDMAQLALRAGYDLVVFYDEAVPDSFSEAGAIVTHLLNRCLRMLPKSPPGDTYEPIIIPRTYALDREQIIKWYDDLVTRNRPTYFIFHTDEKIFSVDFHSIAMCGYTFIHDNTDNIAFAEFDARTMTLTYSRNPDDDEQDVYETMYEWFTKLILHPNLVNILAAWKPWFEECCHIDRVMQSIEECYEQDPS